MTDKKDEALKLALEALEHLQPTALTSFYTIGDRDKAITALREALAEQQSGIKQVIELYDSPEQPAQQQEPVAIVDEDGVIVVCNYKYKPGDKLYTTPPTAQRQWVGLTDEEIAKLDCYDHLKFARAIEAKLKEKNGLHRQHVIDGSPCWCEPETSYTDPETGASVVVHKEPQ